MDEQKRKSGPGMGTALLAGGAGLVGGALLMDAIEDREEEAYQDGFDNGFDDAAGDWWTTSSANVYNWMVIDRCGRSTWHI